MLVPGSGRAEWLEEWSAELDALTGPDGRRPEGAPGVLEFAAGALPHALWMRTEGWTMDGILQDVRYAIRVLGRAPGFTWVAAATLALGIGANAAIFSLVNGLVLREPPGIAEPERLVQIGRSYESAPRWDVFSWPAMKLIEAEAPTLSGVAGYSPETFVIGRGAETERVVGHLVSGSYFDVLGVRPHVGRLLRPDDDVRPGEHHVAVLSHSLWIGRYGGDPDIVGSTITIGSRPWEVVGVVPEDFRGVSHLGTRPELFVPLLMSRYLDAETPAQDWGSSWIDVFGRLEDGTTFEEASASMAVVSARLREASATNQDMLALLARGVGLDPDDREAALRLSGILAVIVALVLLLTCTNVANLFLSRAANRTSELGVRLALGAPRARLARQLVTESTVLSFAAITLAIPLVALAGDLLPLVVPTRMVASLDADVRVYAFLGAIGIAAGLLFGAVPALSWSRSSPVATLREGASTQSRGRSRLRAGLVVAQLGLSLGLVSAAALLGRSVLNAHSADPGFDARALTAAPVDLFTTGRYDEEASAAFFEALFTEAQSRSGMEATLANQIPIAGGHSRASVQPADRAPDEVFVEAEYVVVGPSYFEVMGIPVVRGRALGGFGEEPEPAVVVNEALARSFWPGEDPIGKQLRRAGLTWRIVGVAADVQMRSLRSPGNPAVFYPFDHAGVPYALLHLRGVDGAAPNAETMREIVAAIDPEIPVPTVYDVEAAVVESMGETRTIGYLVGVFAALALTLAAVGLYGLVSFGAAQRVREFGIRIALGARPQELTRLLLRRGLVLAVAGVAFGLLVSLVLARALDSLLFGVAPTDPLTFSAAAILLVGSAAVAAWLPARRAGRVDASISLRNE